MTEKQYERSHCYTNIDTKVICYTNIDNLLYELHEQRLG